jgi:hypothetical protein
METFPILFIFLGNSYTGVVNIQTDESDNTYYKVSLATGNIVSEVEIIPGESDKYETNWKDRYPNTDEPREALNSELVQSIGKEIEKHYE